MRGIDPKLLELKVHIEPGIKNINQLTEYVTSELSANQIQVQSLSKVFIATTRCNIIKRSAVEDKLELEDDFIFKAYDVPNTGRNAKYYAEENVNSNENYRIFVLFELKTEHIASNCNRLLTDLILYKGVSTDDCKYNTPYMIYYLRLFNQYSKNQI